MTEWPVRPHQTEPLLRGWAARYPQWAALDTVQPWTHAACVLTVTDRSVPDEGKGKALIAVPHAHEPAGTAACMDFLSRLLDGVGLDGAPSGLDREEVLRTTLLSFIPDGNPEGRSRSPEDFWDGTKYTNEEFLKIAFGETPAGERFKRVDRWRAPEETVARAGIAYERIDEITYVEPNRDWDSSYFRFVHLLTRRHRFDASLDLHQTEFESSPHNCVLLLPVVWDDLPENIRAYSADWAKEITDAWRGIAGADPQDPRPLGYTGQQRAYFEERWGDLYRAIPHLTVEVQNNNPRTPPDLQRRLADTAIRVTVERLRRERFLPAGRQEGRTDRIIR